jgi:hypothetical protein
MRIRLAASSGRHICKSSTNKQGYTNVRQRCPFLNKRLAAKQRPEKEFAVKPRTPHRDYIYIYIYINLVNLFNIYTFECIL